MNMLFRQKFGFSDSEFTNLQIIKIVKVFLTILYTSLINISKSTPYNHRRKILNQLKGRMLIWIAAYF